jgi:hypothetical protein
MDKWHSKEDFQRESHKLELKAWLNRIFAIRKANPKLTFFQCAAVDKARNRNG